MTVREAFEILGLGVATSSARDVRRAHARLTSLYHPEDHPDEYARIREAYEMALAHVRRAKHLPRTTALVNEQHGHEAAADDGHEEGEELHAQFRARDTLVGREPERDAEHQEVRFEREARYDELAIPDYLRESLETDITLEQEAKAWCHELKVAFEDGLDHPSAFTFLHRNDCERFWQTGEVFDEQVWNILHRHVEKASRHQLKELFKALKAPEGSLTYECLGVRRSYFRKRAASAALTVVLVLAIASYALMYLWAQQESEKKHESEARAEEITRELEKERSQFSFSDIDSLLASNANENEVFIKEYMADELGAGEFEVSEITVFEPLMDAYWELNGICEVRELESGSQFLVNVAVSLGGKVIEATSYQKVEQETNEATSGAPAEGEVADEGGASAFSGGDVANEGQGEDAERRQRLYDQFREALLSE